MQVATPFSTGTGIYLAESRLVVAPEHVVRDNATVVISGKGIDDQLCSVVYLDPVNDLAFLRPEAPLDLPFIPMTEIAERLEMEDPEVIIESLEIFLAGNGRAASRCFNCKEVVFEVRLHANGHCPNCGESVILPGTVEDYQPTGVAHTLEEIIRLAGHDPRLARRGPDLWTIPHGSAQIQMTYHEDSGLITGDAYLCHLPDIPEAELFAFLLRENDKLPQLTFSTYGRQVVLSLLIYDRYLTVSSALPRFEVLFDRADHYDNELVERFGATWL